MEGRYPAGVAVLMASSRSGAAASCRMEGPRCVGSSCCDSASGQSWMSSSPDRPGPSSITPAAFAAAAAASSAASFAYSASAALASAASLSRLMAASARRGGLKAPWPETRGGRAGSPPCLLAAPFPCWLLRRCSCSADSGSSSVDPGAGPAAAASCLLAGGGRRGCGEAAAEAPRRPFLLGAALLPLGGSASCSATATSAAVPLWPCCSGALPALCRVGRRLFLPRGSGSTAREQRASLQP
jgi:hypothetical protein